MELLLQNANNAFLIWKTKNLSERLVFLPKLATLLLENKEGYAKVITNEMHKPISRVRR